MADKDGDRLEEVKYPDSIEVTVPSLPAVTAAEKELAAQAHRDFDNGKFKSCLASLNKIHASRQTDPKVSHNIAVSEYCLSGFKNTDEYRLEMQLVCAQSQVNLDDVDSLDDVDQCVIYYNQAILFYYLRQYHKALYIMDKLFQFIEPMEDGLSRKVMFFLIELYLCTQQPDKAMGMVGFLEKALFGGGGKQSPEKEGGKEDEKDPSPRAQQNEVYKPNLSQYKVRCYIMLKSMKACKREIKNLLTSQNKVTLFVIYLKSDFEYLRGNHKKSMKLLNSTASEQLNELTDSLASMYYNNLGCIHFHMRKHHLGALYFRTAIKENESAVKELKLGDLSKSLSGTRLQTIGVSRHFELLHNIGLQLLHCGKAQEAFDCLIEIVQCCQVNPRIWLRLAECCIMVNKETNDVDRLLLKRSEVIQGSVGSGIHRKLLLGTGSNKINTEAESGAMPVATLEFAAICLRNASMLLPVRPDSSAGSSQTDEEQSKPVYDTVLVPAPPGNPMRGPEVANLRCSILANSAYVALSLGDFLVALQHADTLLALPRLSPAHRYLGNMYKAEALLSCDRIADAVQHLNVDAINDVSTVPPEVRQDPDKDRNGDRDSSEGADTKGSLFPWSPNDLIRAKAITQYNLAVAYAVRGEYDKAMINLTKSTQSIGMPLPSQVYYLRLYLDLLEGRRKIAQGIIKEHFGHVTPNRV